MNLKEFVDLLEKKGKLKRITKEVDPIYEVALFLQEEVQLLQNAQ